MYQTHVPTTSVHQTKCASWMPYARRHAGVVTRVHLDSHLCVPVTDSPTPHTVPSGPKLVACARIFVYSMTENVHPVSDVIALFRGRYFAYALPCALAVTYQ